MIDNEGDTAETKSSNRIIYGPQIPDILELGGSWSGLAASVSFDVPSDDERAVDYTDYRLSLYFSWIGLEANFTEFVRFRIEDSYGFAEDLEDEQIFNDSMFMRFMSANLYLFPLRWNFDFDAAFDPAKEKSTGFGLGAIASWNSLELNTDRGLVPGPWRSAFGSDGGFDRGELSGLTGQIALSGVLSLASFYVSALIAYKW